eukprot:CAMPEP_0172306084 /NCGR_PEP_ID=MMETSP1058-20130122/7225_1 /TAXON_ID=83371 /ORGANISM="Detonula confervacea, Strain CCMP 353" /LENGTH=1054 /DNA_ID=CAMNT_0013017861 /DNA_START=53 /DNA_END=3217 /DNA_ORIENTATION=+
MEDGEDNVGMERQARIMELAQQQQMALLQLEEVVQNQINLRDDIVGSANNNDGLPREQGQHQPQEEEENQLLLLADMNMSQEEEEEEEQQQPQPLPIQNNLTQRQRLRRQMERHEGGHHLCSNITQIYFILSALLALLAVVTSPSSMFFTSIRVSVKSSVSSPTKATKLKDVSQLQHAVDAFKVQARKLEEGAVDVDINGNIIDDKDLKKGEWEAVVAHSKVKHSSSASDSSKKKGEPQNPPHSHSSTSWTGRLVNFVGGILIEQYSSLQQLKLQLDLAYSHPPPETSQSIATTDTEQLSSSTRWVRPWEWMTQKRANDSSEKNEDSLKQTGTKDKTSKSNRRHGHVNNVKLHSLLSPMFRVIDPSFLSTEKRDEATDSSTTISQDHPPEEAKSPTSPFMTIVNKILSSTPRLIAIANLLLAVTYLIQSAVADVFLGPINASNAAGNNPNTPTGPPATATRFLDDDARRQRRAGRERSGGCQFLVFKLLLISAVLEPDSVDLFILLFWYTFLSFLRSLAHIAGSTSNQLTQSGEPPSPGALRLLILVFACDASAAMGCVALFYTTGWNMLLLLTCDCVLLGVDVVAHIMRYAGATMEEAHRIGISHLEERQLELYAQRRERMESSDDEIDSSQGDEMENENSEVAQGNEIGNENHEVVGESGNDVLEEDRESSTEVNGLALEDELRRIDQAVDMGETAYSHRMGLIETSLFSLEMFTLLVTIAHYLHIWALHGTSFGTSLLVDGVIALHLHSTISLIGKKIAERRNVHRISQELNSTFPDANDLDIRKASAAGDVCCICLNSMLVGGVKKVGCGHLFHTNCLREVVERERSFAAAKCPLCRASLVTGRQHPQMVGGLGNNGNNETNNPANDGAEGAGADERQAQPAQPVNPQLNPGEQSLLRFSTENIFPAWLPVPAFAFEVVRRETMAVVEPNPDPDGGWQRFFRRGGQMQAVEANNNNNNQENDEGTQPQEQLQPQGETSFWRRLLILLGAIPMTPEEEGMALEQLVDMFPQYDRADLLRELRARRSAEAVAESILLGISGLPRGGGEVDLE